MKKEEMQKPDLTLVSVPCWDLVGMLLHGQFLRAFLTINVLLVAGSFAAHFFT